MLVIMDWYPQYSLEMERFKEHVEPLRELTPDSAQRYTISGADGEEQEIGREQFLDRLDRVHESEQAGDYLLQTKAQYSGTEPVDLSCVLRLKIPEELERERAFAPGNAAVNTAPGPH